VKIATDYDTNLPPEKLKAATQNEQNDGWLIVKNRPLCKYLHNGRYAKYRIMQSILFVSPSLGLIISLRGE